MILSDEFDDYIQEVDKFYIGFELWSREGYIYQKNKLKRDKVI